MLTSLILAVALAATPATRPAVVIPVPATAEAYLTLQKNRDALAKQVAAMTAKLEAMDEALQKADGRAKEAESAGGWPKVHVTGLDLEDKLLVKKMVFGRVNMVKLSTTKFDGFLPVKMSSGLLPLSRMRQTTKVYQSNRSIAENTEKCEYARPGELRLGGMDRAAPAVNVHVGIYLDGKLIFEDMARPDHESVNWPEPESPWWKDKKGQ